MRLQDERASGLLLRPVDADHDRRIGMLLGEFRPAGVARDRVPVHREPLHREAEIAQRAEDEVLDGVLRTAQRGEADQRLGEFDLLGEAVADGCDDAVAQSGFQAHSASSDHIDGVRCAPARRL
jgi:hypothetical protein